MSRFRRSSLKLVALIGAAALVLAACGGGGGNKTTTSGATYAIGFVGPKTGDNANLGLNIVGGAKLAVDQARKAGVNVVLKEFDTQGDPAQASTVQPQILNDPQIIGLVGPTFSGETKALLPALQDSGLAMISASATNAKLPTIVSNETVFHRLIPDKETQKRLGELVERLGDNTFRVREKAAAELTAAGPVALPLLARAKQGADPEIRRRAEIGDRHLVGARRLAVREHHQGRALDLLPHRIVENDEQHRQPEIAQHLRTPICSRDYAINEIRSRQVQHLFGNRIAAMRQQAFGFRTENLFDVFPDPNIPATANRGTRTFPRNAPFGFNGRYVYGRLSIAM